MSNFTLELTEETKQIVDEASQDRKGYAFHYLLGALSVILKEHKTEEEFNELIQDSLED